MQTITIPPQQTLACPEVKANTVVTPTSGADPYSLRQMDLASLMASMTTCNDNMIIFRLNEVVVVIVGGVGGGSSSRGALLLHACIAEGAT